MKNEDLLKAIGKIDEKYLIEAQERTTKKAITEESIVMGVEVVKERKIKKIIGKITAAAAAVALIGGTAVFIGKEHFTDKNNISTSVSDKELIIRLENKMTETELARISKHGLTLLVDPEEITEPETFSPELTEHKVYVEFHTRTADEMLSEIEGMRDKMSDKDYEQALDEIRRFNESGKDFRIPVYILVDGKICQHSSPYFFPDYDGGEISFTQTTIITNSDGKITHNDEELSFANMEEYFDWIREQDKEAGLTEKEIERDILNLTIANEAIKNGTYEEIPEGTVDINDSSLYIKSTEEDYRHVWEYDRESVEEIKDFIEEINIYDEELDTEFLVHVTLPPNYDENKTYPVFFLTDGVWRFGNHPELRKLMENNEADETILVSLGYNYHIDGTHEYNRFNDLVVRRDKLLDFITDNLMPYLGENYNIDYTNSTLYGHSDGGVFTHNALFKSDMYENQPFGNYIIGSPALWGLYNYNESIDNDSEDCKNDYGYFDRNEKLDKSVFLCAGALEDPDYADNYNGHDTTLEGVAKLNERLESHGADVTYKLYDSHHYQFIPEMLCEVLKTYYPA